MKQDDKIAKITHFIESRIKDHRAIMFEAYESAREKRIAIIHELNMINNFIKAIDDEQDHNFPFV